MRSENIHGVSCAKHYAEDAEVDAYGSSDRRVDREDTKQGAECAYRCSLEKDYWDDAEVDAYGSSDCRVDREDTKQDAECGYRCSLEREGTDVYVGVQDTVVCMAAVTLFTIERDAVEDDVGSVNAIAVCNVL